MYSGLKWSLKMINITFNNKDLKYVATQNDGFNGSVTKTVAEAP